MGSWWKEYQERQSRDKRLREAMTIEGRLEKLEREMAEVKAKLREVR